MRLKTDRQSCNQLVRAAARNCVAETLEDRKYFAISYLTEGASVPTGDQPVEVIAADFNGDGKMDAATGDYTSKTVTVFLNGGAGDFMQSQSVQLPGDMKQIAAADMNGDGKLDIIAREFNGNDFRLLPGNGDGTFGTVATLNGSGGWNTFALGDIDGDGDTDIVTGRSAGGQDGLYVFRNKGTSTFEFEAGQYVAGIGAVYHVHVADVNKDGQLDVLTVGPSSGAHAGVFLNAGNGQFGPHTAVTTRFTSDKDAVTAADVNADGNVDMIVQYGGGSFDVMLGNGSGGFGAPAGAAALGSSDIFVVDINGDGKLDIVSGSDTYGAICVNTGNGDGTFDTEEKEYLFGSNVTDFAVADFDGDGKLDVIVADKGDDELIIVKNSLSGPVSPPSSPPPPATPGAFDLTTSIQADLPSAAVGGTTKGKATAVVTNAGTDSLSGDVTVSLYASGDGTLDASDTLITTTVKKLKLAAGKAKSLAMKFVFPSVADGDYQLLTKVEAAGEGVNTNNIGSTGSTVRIAAPFVDLTPTVQSVASKKGKPKSSITLQNLGNQTATGNVTLTLSAVPEAGGASVAIGTVTRSVTVKSGAAKKVNLSMSLPPAITGGNYRLEVTASSSQDTLTSNDVATGAGLFTVA